MRPQTQVWFAGPPREVWEGVLSVAAGLGSCLGRLLLLAALGTGAVSAAVPPEFRWFKQSAADSGRSRVNALAVAPSGFLVAAGQFDGTRLHVEGWGELLNENDPDLFVVRLDDRTVEGTKLPSMDWLLSGSGGAGPVEALAVAIGGPGEDIYLTGYFAGPEFSLGGSTVADAQAADYSIFLARLSQAGGVQWIRTAGGQGLDQGDAVAAARDGSCFVAGTFSGTCFFGSTNLSSLAGSSDVFLAKYSSQGELVWVRQVGGVSSDSAAGITLGSSGEIFVTGSFNDTAVFGAWQLTSAGASDAFLAKFDPRGDVLWVRSVGGPDADRSFAGAVDQDGNVAITGRAGQSARVGNLQTTTSGAASSPFVAVFDNSGQPLWVRRMVDSTSANASGVGRAIQADARGHWYVTGSMGGDELRVGSTLMQAQGGEDLFVIGLTPSGNVEWWRWEGGQGDDSASAIAVRRREEIFIAGSFRDSEWMLNELEPRPSAGSDDTLFIANLSGLGLTLELSSGDPVVDKSSSIGVTVHLANRRSAEVVRIYDGNTLLFERIAPDLDTQPEDPFTTTFRWTEPPLGRRFLQARVGEVSSEVRELNVVGYDFGFLPVMDLVTRPALPGPGEDFGFGATLLVTNGLAAQSGDLRIALEIRTAGWFNPQDRNHVDPAPHQTNYLIAGFLATHAGLPPGGTWRLDFNRDLNQAEVICPGWEILNEAFGSSAIQYHAFAVLEERIGTNEWRRVDRTKLVSSVPQDLVPDTGPILPYFRLPASEAEWDLLGRARTLEIIGPLVILDGTSSEYVVAAEFEGAPGRSFFVSPNQFTNRFLSVEAFPTKDLFRSYAKGTLQLDGNLGDSEIVLEATYRRAVTHALLTNRLPVKVFNHRKPGLRLDWIRNLASSGASLKLSGPPIQQSVEIQYSTGLMPPRWESWKSVPWTNLGLQGVEVDITGLPARFYRLRVP